MMGRLRTLATLTALAATFAPLPARAAATYELLGAPLSKPVSSIAGSVAPTALSASATGQFVLYSAFEYLSKDAVQSRTGVYVYDRSTKHSEEISVSSGGVKAGVGAGPVFSPGSISADGRYVVFCSWSENLVPHDDNNFVDVFLRDRTKQTTTRISVDRKGRELPAPPGSAGAPLFEPGSDADCQAAISADGSRVLWRTAQDVLGDGAKTATFYSYNRLTRRAVAVDRIPGTRTGSGARIWHGSSAMSADGRYVVFSTAARMLPADTDDDTDVYRRDVVTGKLTMVTDPDLVKSYQADPSPSALNVPTLSLPDSSAYRQATIDATGRHVAFLAMDLRDRLKVTISGTTIEDQDVYAASATARVMVADLVARTASVLVSRARTGKYANVDGPDLLRQPVVTPDGRSVFFIQPADGGFGMPQVDAGTGDSPDQNYSNWSSLARVAVAGGTPVVLTTPYYAACLRWQGTCLPDNSAKWTNPVIGTPNDIVCFAITAGGHELLFWTAMPFVAADTDYEYDVYAWHE